MKVLSLFSGIGAFEKALKNLGIDFDLVGFCEIDKYAAKSYCAIHDVPETMNLGDITKVDTSKLPNDIDLITYGFPCQDISIAGKQKGLINDDGSQTRSGLFFEALRIIEATKPKVAIAENVKNLVGKKFNAQFQVVLASLESAGYNNYFKVLNAKDYGVPQNRERVFIVSIRKDIDNGAFKFPETIPLVKRLKDVLENEVDENYYLSNKMVSYVTAQVEGCGYGGKVDPEIAHSLTATMTKMHRAGVDNYVTPPNRNKDNRATDRILRVGNINSSQDGVVVSAEGIAPTHTAGHGDTPKIAEEPILRQVGQIYPNSGNPQAGRIYDAEGVCPTMDTCSGGNRMPKVAVAMRGRYTEQGEVHQNIEISDREYANAITTVQKDSLVAEPTIAKCVGGIGEKKSNGGQQYYQQDRVYQGDIALAHPSSIPGGSYRYAVEESRNLRIRKLTPKECFRLMGFDDESFHKAEAVNSNSQLYKQAGNSIVVDVLEAIFRQMLDSEGHLLV